MVDTRVREAENNDPASSSSTIGQTSPIARRSEGESFAQIARLIAAPCERAVRAVNATLIELHWEIASVFNRKIEEWGDGVGTGWLHLLRRRSRDCAA
ncbi:hypothetical protein Terro_2413 [Terriglobus roseus DSM 18391]|uniref:YhcG N-terminal domain-containing protein n=1 Tax=Terriglobus roseus (strain DSM 18391 / NRRL B-41598 / KBS 63) TaxID=926566 RepID=I3ZGG0_TERRK|nr:hypothetical protein Terro_2047 [Terriglobus roseus DSM 18391]AFL88670.1 hypothetical protein Terro_2413 [Terriglobus roseus DSM 18391]